MTVELKWVPSMEASDHRKAGWREVLIYAGSQVEPGHFLMASPVVEEAEPDQVEDEGDGEAEE